MADVNEQLNQLDKTSREFIEWNFEQLKDDESLTKMINEVTDVAKEWLLGNLKDLREKLMQKMIQGALEHGAPIHPIEKVQKELEGEYLDLIGWTQVKKYNEKRISKK